MLSMETLALARAYADEIKSQITPGFEPKVVTTLPIKGDSRTLYLIKKTSPSTSDVYDEYIWVENKYEHIGSTQGSGGGTTPSKYSLVKTITTTERVSTITETFDAVQKLFVYVTVPVDTEYTSGKAVTIYLSVPGISNKVYSTQIANGAGLTERHWFFEVDFSDNIPRWAFSTVGNNATARINETWQTGINFFTAMLGKEFTVNGFTLSCDNAEFCEGTKIDIYAM